MSKQDYLIANVEKAMRQLESAGLVFRREDITFKWSKGRELKANKQEKTEGICRYFPSDERYEIEINNIFLTYSKNKKYNKRMISIIQHELIHYYCREYFINFINIEGANSDISPMFVGVIFWLRAKKHIKVFCGSGIDSTFCLYHKTLCNNLKNCETLSQCKAQLKIYNKALQSIAKDFDNKMKQKMYEGKTLTTYNLNWYDTSKVDYTFMNNTFAEVKYFDMPQNVSKLDQDYSVPYFNIFIGLDFNIEDDCWDKEEGLFTLFQYQNLEDAMDCQIAYEIEEPKYTVLSDSIIEEVRRKNEKKLA